MFCAGEILASFPNVNPILRRNHLKRLDLYMPSSKAFSVVCSQGTSQSQILLSAKSGIMLCQAGKWKQNWVLLHVYSDNFSGVSLYQRTGYSLIFQDPSWQRIFGRRQRMLLAKGAAVTGAAGAIQSISENVMRLWQSQENAQAASADS